MSDDDKLLTPAERKARREGYEPGSRYGKALALDADGDLIVRRGSFARVYDQDAVIQDLKVALLTPEGPDVPRSDPIRPDYGRDIFRMLGESVGSFRREIRRTIGPDADPRVESILNIDITWAPSPANRSGAIVDVQISLEEFDGVHSITFPAPNLDPDANEL